MRKSPVLLLCALAGLGLPRVHAAQAPVDADLLEFLGSIGEDDDDWQEYLERRPVKAVAGKAAKDAQKAPAKSPGKPDVPAASKENDK